MIYLNKLYFNLRLIKRIKKTALICLGLWIVGLSLDANAQMPTPSTTLTPSKFKRIISLKPNITMTLMSLGFADKMVGITKFCPLPNPAAEIIADYNSIDLEKVLRLKPDLVILSPENSQSRQFEALKSAGVNVQIFNFGTYEELKDSILKISTLLGDVKKGENLINDMNQKLLNLKAQLKPKHPEVPTSFIVIVQRHPLMVAAGQTYISTLLAQLGMVNAFEKNQIAYPVIDEEEVVREIVDYTFDLDMTPKTDFEATDEEFLNKQVIKLKIEDFLAAPQSIDSLVKLMGELKK